MINDKQLAYNSAMDALRRQYAERLRVREVAIELLLEDAQNQPLSAEKHAELHNHAHSLAGSGATYGYPDISKAARILEESLDSGAAEAVYVSLGRKLVDICRSVSSTQAHPNHVQGVKVLSKDASDKQGKSLLVIDDDASVHDFIRQLFKSEMYVHSAHNGEQGLKLAQSEKPGLILLDGTMPGMKGMDVLAALQQNEELKKIPVMMLTANNKNAYVARAIESGVAGYIVKPFDPVTLASRVRPFLVPSTAKE